MLIGIGYKHLQVRKTLFETFSTLITFGKLIHSSSWVDATAVVEKGCVIYPGCIIDAKAVIKANTILNIGCSISHDTTINSHCFLSPRVAIAGFVCIEECCILGINSTIIDNLNIVAKTQLGGATVVINSIEKSGLYVGNPADSSNLVIGGKYFTDLLDHGHGTITANSSAIVDSAKKVDEWNVDNITLNGTTL